MEPKKLAAASWGQGCALKGTNCHAHLNALFSGIAKAECSVHVLAVKIMQIIFNQGSVGKVVSEKKAQSVRGSEKC